MPHALLTETLLGGLMRIDKKVVRNGLNTGLGPNKIATNQILIVRRAELTQKMLNAKKFKTTLFESLYNALNSLFIILNLRTFANNTNKTKTSTMTPILSKSWKAIPLYHNG